MDNKRCIICHSLFDINELSYEQKYVPDLRQIISFGQNYCLSFRLSIYRMT
jgi:hypothetical protein